jgi:outer membrane protein assembly factor BamD
MKTDRFLARFLGVSLGLSLAAFSCGSAFAQKKIKVVKAPPDPPAKPEPTTESSEPDKVLYERAMVDMKKRHYIEERLSLQTLINTYPDSEYLAKSKLAVADSYYQEGGTSNYTEAIAEYKSFIVFFPFLDEASYAQMQVAMAHYKMMEKSDRDTSEAGSAEAEFQTFLLKYPDSKLRPQAEQHLRETQEVLGDGAFRVARFYYLRPDYRAAAARLVDLTQRYPLYSQSDEALWMLGGIYDVAKKASKNEDDKNHWADLAAKCYTQIVVSYPLSDRAALAKQRLKEMGMTVPDSDPAAAKRMQQEIDYQKAHRQKAFIKGPVAMLKSSPDMSTAARNGTPNLNPPEATVSATDILTPGAKGPTFNLAAASSSGGSTDSDGPIVGSGAVVPGTGINGDSQSDSDSGGHQVVGTPVTGSEPANSANDIHDATVNAPTTGSTPTVTVGTTDPVDRPAAQATQDQSGAQTGQSTTQTPAAQSQTPAAPAGKNESSSTKKKKGLSKLNPF